MATDDRSPLDDAPKPPKRTLSLVGLTRAGLIAVTILLVVLIVR